MLHSLCVFMTKQEISSRREVIGKLFPTSESSLRVHLGDVVVWLVSSVIFLASLLWPLSMVSRSAVRGISVSS